ncbi:MAG: penicillin acylase family protein, partial [Flavipsychrobacter sp.]
MRILRAVILLILTIGFVYLLNNPIGPLPALGSLLDPVNGCWANAEPVDANFTEHIQLKGLDKPVTVWFDDRMVAHVHATDNYDLYFAEGYIHAYFRLWQMDMETRAAAGRISEVAGAKALKFDRTQRRKGMVFGAENSLQAIEADPRTKEMLDAYTAG